MMEMESFCEDILQTDWWFDDFMMIILFEPSSKLVSTFISFFWSPSNAGSSDQFSAELYHQIKVQLICSSTTENAYSYW